MRRFPKKIEVQVYPYTKGHQMIMNKSFEIVKILIATNNKEK